MKSSGIYFDECNECEFREYSDHIIGCLNNRLGLAFHNLLQELPIINKFIDDVRFCHLFIKESEG